MINRCLGYALFASVVAWGGPIMHIHDDRGLLATVDVANGQVTAIGGMSVVMTDIAFSPSGALFGISTTSLYSINPLTGAVTLIGAHSIALGNALVFGSDGSLYAAGGGTTSLFLLNPLTGAATELGDTGFESGGDLAFHNGDLYLASIDSNLVRLNLSSLQNSVNVGSFGVNGVYGLASGNDGVLYGVAGTQIFVINTLTGAATNPIDFAGQFSIAFGQAFYTESGAPIVTPEPSTFVLTGLAAVGLLFARRRSI